MNQSVCRRRPGALNLAHARTNARGEAFERWLRMCAAREASSQREWHGTRRRHSYQRVATAARAGGRQGRKVKDAQTGGGARAYLAEEVDRGGVPWRTSVGLQSSSKLRAEPSPDQSWRCRSQPCPIPTCALYRRRDLALVSDLPALPLWRRTRRSSRYASAEVIHFVWAQSSRGWCFMVDIDNRRVEQHSIWLWTNPARSSATRHGGRQTHFTMAACATVIGC